jgi:hypothetical protein
MGARVLRSCTALSVPVKSGEGLCTTRPEFTSEHIQICFHGFLLKVQWAGLKREAQALKRNHFYAYINKNQQVMEDLVVAAKIILFVSIVNVWFFRTNRGTRWRAGDAGNMKEEFKVYGLSETMMYSVGILKVLSAIGLIVSIWFPALAIPCSAAMGFLMVGAIWMHLKVKDPLKKALPAFVFLLLSVFIWLYSTGLI